MKSAALLFDFDGVLIESEYVGNKQLADWLTQAGRPTSVAESMSLFMGYAGRDFRARMEQHLGRPLPPEFDAARRAEDDRVMRDGIDAVAGAVTFVRSLPATLPRAVVSSSGTRWIDRHLRHIGLRDVFGTHIYSGAEHVERGKPAPDLYHHAAAALGIAIEQCAILEDSPVGATGAVASGGYVIGLCAGTHCAIDHEERLRAIGVDAIAHDYDEVRCLLRL